MKALAGILVALIVLIQYPLWFGKGGWLRVRAVDRELMAARESNRKLEVRNDSLAAEVRDLKTGTEAIEERARSELGMIRGDEVYFEIEEPAPKKP